MGSLFDGGNFGGLGKDISELLCGAHGHSRGTLFHAPAGRHSRLTSGRIHPRQSPWPSAVGVKNLSGVRKFTHSSVGNSVILG